MKNHYSIVLLMALISFLFCAGSTAKTLPTVYVVNYPLKYFSERIGGPFVNVVLPRIKGDPAFWQPTRKTIRRYQAATLILLNGANYAKWVNYATLPSAKMIDTSSGFQDQYIKTRSTTHTHGEKGDHAHGGYAFTTWLDLSLAVKQAKAIEQAFIMLDPKHRSRFIKNYGLLKQRLKALDSRISQITAKNKGFQLIASHPIYQYFARRYRVTIRSLLGEPDEYSTAIKWENLTTLLTQYPTKYILWEKQPSQMTTKKLHEMHIQSIVFSSCANQPTHGNFITTMESNIRNLEKAYQ